MVVQRFRISSVLGLGGTRGAFEAVSLPLDVMDPELSELALELRRSGRLSAGVLRPLPPTLGLASSFRLEVDSLSEERLEKLPSLLVLLMLRVRPSDVDGSPSICVCDLVSERTSRDRALCRRPGTPLDGPAGSICGLFSSLMLADREARSSAPVARFRVELCSFLCRLKRPARGLLYGCRYMEGM